MRPLLLSIALLSLVAGSALGQPKKGGERPRADEPRRVAIAYLKALEGRGDDAAREYLLGELTLTAEDFRIPNWRIKEREPPLVEVGALAEAVREMKALDKAGRETLNSVVNLDGDDEIAALSQEQAERMMAPTKKRARAIRKKFPVFAYVARVGKDVFWHPSNPWRTVVEQMDEESEYRLEVHLFRIEEKAASGKTRVWPLRVLRIRTKAYDSGWKILPASDWDPEF